MPDQFWMVVNVAESSYVCDAYALNPKRKGPTCMYWRRDWAEDEALRLAKRYPEGDFRVLECVSAARALGCSGEWVLEPAGEPAPDPYNAYQALRRYRNQVRGLAAAPAGAGR